MPHVDDTAQTPTKRPGTSSSTTTPRGNRQFSRGQTSMENDLPLPPQDYDEGETPTPNLDAYFMPLPPSRDASIYSVNRATLSGQLSQLTSTDLPDADSLAAKITELPTASAAAKALTNSAKQIKSWIRTAADVLGGLDAQDDVDWAGAGSKDGVLDVETAIQKFEKLVVTYISAVEDAQKRPDIKSVPKLEMTIFLDTLEEVISSWEQVKASLKKVKHQSALAEDWEHLWNVTLGEIGQEIEELSTLVFELEEKRYIGNFEDLTLDNTATGIDLNELSTIVEETPPLRRSARKGERAISGSPLASPGLQGPAEDSGLLALFARMQPLRASIDFLPMQLTTYESKASKVFPSACSELQARRQTLESRYATLETDAETLRRELGEDKWVVVFRNASRQAQKMCDSVGKGIQKLRETMQDESRASNAGLLAKRISDYEAKRNNYGPAIRKVLSMIEKGVKERDTVNGEILRIHQDTQQMWTNLEKKLSDTDAFLEEAQSQRSQQLRDSISTILSTDMSGLASAVDTPDSSLASSPAAGPVDQKINLPATPDMHLSTSRNGSVRSLSSSRQPISRRVASQPPTSSASSRRPSNQNSPMLRLSTASPTPASRMMHYTPLSSIPSSRTVTPGTATASKPRWSAGVAVDRKLLETKPSFKPTAYAQRLKESKPSVYSYRSTSGSTTSSTLPSPLGRITPNHQRHSLGSYEGSRAASSLGIRSRRGSSPTPSYDGSVTGSINGENADTRPRSRLYRPSLPAIGSTATTPSIRVPSYGARTTGTSRRTSMLPLPSMPASPSPFVSTMFHTGSIHSSVIGSDDDDIMPSIEDDIPSPTFAKRRIPVRPSSSLARPAPKVAHTRTSLLRAGSATPGAGPARDKPKWR